MTSLLVVLFPGADRPSIREVNVVRAPYVLSAYLPTIIFTFNSPTIAREVRFRLLRHSKNTPDLERIFIEPALTLATRVRIEILQAIRKCLTAQSVVSYVRKFSRSPSLVVVHDQRERSYDFVEACVAFRSLLTAETLRFAYAVAGRHFNERLSSHFIVLIDGGQPLPTFTALPVPVSNPQPSTSAAAATVSVSVPRPGYLLQALAPGSARKRLNESLVEPVASKRVAP
jgi:hypothetical protein